MHQSLFRRSALSVAIGSALFAVSGVSFASAFGLVESGASGMGNAYAGAAAIAGDASTVWWNPAGMTRLDAISVHSAIHVITPSSKFGNGNSKPACVAAGLCRPLGGEGGDAGDTAFVPSVYAVLPLGRLALGLGISAPFGLKTEYESDWIGRYQAIKSDVKTINVNPSIAFKINDMISIGAGANYQKIDAELTSAVNITAVTASAAQAAAAAGAIPPGAIPALLAGSLGLADGEAKVKGNDSAYGYNLGIMLNLTPATRLGLSYRSSIKYTVEGDVSFSLPAATGTIAALLNGATQPGQRLAAGGVHADLKTPDSFSLSAAHDVNSQLQLLADVSWTGWSKIPQLQFVRSNGQVLSTYDYQWKDTWRYALGANFNLNDRLMLRGGVAYDQTPMDTAHRTPRLPDADRTWLSLGARYAFLPNLALDFGYTHIFLKDPKIDNRSDGVPAANATLDGTYSSNVNIFSLGLSYNFK